MTRNSSQIALMMMQLMMAQTGCRHLCRHLSHHHSVRHEAPRLRLLPLSRMLVGLRLVLLRQYLDLGLHMVLVRHSTVARSTQPR